MPNRSSSIATLVAVSSLLAFVNVGCSGTSTVNQPTSNVAQVSATTPVSSPVPVAAPAAPTASQPDPYQQAIAKASSAFNISQSAQSKDDWRLVASRWQQAIDLMATVPTSSLNHAQAQRKLPEYQRNLSYAQRQANRPTDTPNPGRVIVTAPSGGQSPPYAADNSRRAYAPSTSPGGDGIFHAPIIRRMGGTPVIHVIFNGNQTYEMIVDTGASGTLITQPMATALGVVPVGQARVDTASASDVPFSIGYVDSIQVDGAVAQNVPIAIAGPGLPIGLLGHDFFGNFDVTIRQHEVEFRER